MNNNFIFENRDGIKFYNGDRVRWIKTDYMGYDTGEVVEGILKYEPYNFRYYINTDDCRLVGGFDKSCKFELVKKAEKYMVTRNYTISARSEQQLNCLEQLFIQFQSLGNLGRSREVKVYVDGDGQVQFKFLSDGKQLKETKDIGYGSVDFINNKFDIG